MSILKLEGVKYRTPGWMLEASFTLKHAITGIFGSSGAGKTTLLEIIAGLRAPESGTVTIGGEEVYDRSQRTTLPPEKRRIGYMPQDLALFPHQTVSENLRYGIKPGADSARFEQVLEVLQIGDLLSRYPQNLSGGEKQRVALGRALLSSPKLLLLDEPLVNLDLPLRDKLLELFLLTVREFNTPMIYVTHETGELARLGSEVILLENGRVRAQAIFSELFEPVHTTSFKLHPRGANVE